MTRRAAPLRPGTSRSRRRPPRRPLRRRRESIAAMEWFIAVIAVVALAVAAMAAAGGVGEMSREPVYDTYRQDLPDRPLTAEDLETVRFGVTLRGYAMGQVDDLIERLGREIGERDARIAELSGLYRREDRYQPEEQG